MSNITLGKIIEKLRIEKNYSRRQLCQGLCSTQMLIKIETDQSDVDKFLADILLQRLGKSSDKLEIILSDEEYSKIYARDEIEELIWKKDRDRAEAILHEYEALYARDSNVHKMFVLRTRAYMSHLLDEDWNQAESYIRQAIEMTLPGVTAENINEYLLSTVELENILELGYLIFMQGRVKEAEWIFEACYRYIENNVTDGVENTKLTSKNAWLSSLVYIKRKEYKKAFEICQEAFENLRKYGNLYFMIPILQQLITCCDAMDRESDGKDYRNYYNILKSLYEEYGESWYCHNSIFHNCSLTVYHLASEFIRQERHARNMTQEQLIEGVYEVPENLSRVEGGKVSPTRKKFEGLMKNLGIERGKYCGTLAVEDFEILELKYEMDILIGTGKYDEAEEKLSELKNMIDCDDGMNAMAIEIYQMSLELSRKLSEDNDDVGEISLKAKKILQSNGLLSNEKVYRIPFLNEMAALNMLSICLKRTGKHKEAIDIYYDILKCVEESTIDERYQNWIMSPIMANLDLYEPTEDLRKKGLAYELHCEKGKLLYMYFYSQMKLEKDKNTKQSIACLAFYLSKLFYRDVNMRLIKEYYKETFGQEIE